MDPEEEPGPRRDEELFLSSLRPTPEERARGGFGPSWPVAVMIVVVVLVVVLAVISVRNAPP